MSNTITTTAPDITADDTCLTATKELQSDSIAATLTMPPTLRTVKPLYRAFVVLRSNQKVPAGRVDVRFFVGGGVSHIIEIDEEYAEGLPRVTEMMRVKRYIDPKTQARIDRIREVGQSFSILSSCLTNTW